MRSLFAACLVGGAVTSAAVSVSAEPTPYSGDVRSVRFRRTTTVVAAPDASAAKVGVVRRGTRAAVRSAAPGGVGCPDGRWIEIAPRGWACETDLEPSSEPPTPPGPVPALDAGAEDDSDPLVPGAYGLVRGQNVIAYDSPEAARAGNGRVLAGKHSVRLRGSVLVDGTKYVKTGRGDLIDATAIRRLSPSRFRGVTIADPAQMPAWAVARRAPKQPVTVREAPRTRSRKVGELARRTVVTILEHSPDGRFVRIGAGQWLARADVRVAIKAAPPDGAEPGEKWIDIDLDEQVLIAYEGERPVYATLVSTGKREHRTPTLVTRITTKLERRTMNSDRNPDDVYSVADVPWTMYYDRSFALHASYWHDGFGGPRSHGCINLAPRDARALYHWSSPDIPSGWIEVVGDERTPGSLVRVRSRRDGDPAFRGYARSLRERRVIATN